MQLVKLDVNATDSYKCVEAVCHFSSDLCVPDG
jgi:hypothetical protein